MKLVKVTKENMVILENLMPLYLHEVSRYNKNRKPDIYGKYEYKDLSLYIKELDLFPYIIYVDDQPIGFIFVDGKKYAPKGYDYVISELFIIYPYRRLGYGRKVVITIFEMFQGKFLVVEMINNLKAIRFWKNILIEQQITFGEREIKIEGIECICQTFLII